MSKIQITDDTIRAMEDLGKAINNAAVRMGEIFAVAFDPLTKAIRDVYRIFNIRTPYEWERYDGETDDEWQHRLAYDNHLDNPDARWEYQKLVWAYPIRHLLSLAKGKKA